MRWPCIAINAAMFTTAIRIEAHLEPDIRAVILGDDGARCVGQVLGRRTAQRIDVFFVKLNLLELELMVRRLKPVRRIDPRPRPRGAGISDMLMRVSPQERRQLKNSLPPPSNPRTAYSIQKNNTSQCRTNGLCVTGAGGLRSRRDDWRENQSGMRNVGGACSKAWVRA